MHVEQVRTIEHLAAVVPEWQALANRHPSATPFHLPAWLLTWWQHFGSGTLQSLLLWDETELTGIIPAFCLPWMGHQQLTLIGTGISDYLEPLNPAYSAELMAEAVQSMPEWTLLSWQDLSSRSAFLQPALWSCLRVTSEPDTPCTSISLSGSFADFWQARGKDLRRNVRRYRDRAAQLGGDIIFSVHSKYQENSMRSLADLHAARWQRQGQAGTIAENRAASFLQHVCRSMSDAGLLRFFTLEWRGTVVAITVGFLWRGELYSYLSAFNPEHEALGFGRLLLYESLQYAWQHEWSRWRFLRGEESYKHSWGASTETKARLTVQR